MEVCKILLVCVAVVAMNAREAQSHALVDFTNDCACFPKDKDSIRISKLADKYGKHERKVVYLFKHLDSQDITIYIPNEEKQLNFPDLTVNSAESYDIHKLPHLYYVFDNPSNMVSVKDHIHSIVTTNEELDNSEISKHPAIIPDVNKITTDSTGLHGETGYVVIDNGNNQPNNVPTNDKIVLLISPKKHDVDTINVVTEHDNEHELQPKPVVTEVTIDSTGVHDGENGYVIIDNGEYQPNNVHPSTEKHEHSIDYVTLVPTDDKIVVDVLIPPKEHDVDIINVVTEHDNEHELQPKPVVTEVTIDSTGVHDGENGYVIIDNGEYQPNNVHPSTEKHEHTIDYVTLVPTDDKIVVDLPIPPKEHDVDIINVVTEHDNEHELQPKPVVTEVTIDSTGVHDGENGYVIIDNGEYQPNNVHPSTEKHEHSIDYVTLVPTDDKIVVDVLIPPKEYDADIINVVTEHDNEHELQPKPVVTEVTIDSTGVHDGENGYVIIDNGEYQPNNVHPSTEKHEHTIDYVTLVPTDDKIVVDLPIPPKEHNVDIINVVTEHDNEHELQPKPVVTEVTIDSTGVHDGENGYVIIDNGEYQPNNVHPSTEKHEHSIDYVTLVPTDDKIVVDVLIPPKEYDADIINVVTEHDNEHELQPKPVVTEVTIDSTGVHDGENGYVIIDNGEYQPNNVHPSTEKHEHSIDYVTLVPTDDKIVVDVLIPPKEHDVDIINVVTEHDNEHELQPKPVVTEVTIDSTGVHDGENGYVIIDNGEYQHNNVHPSTEIHEHTINSVTLVPKYEKLVIDYPNHPEKHSLHGDLSVILGHDSKTKPKDKEQITSDNKIYSVHELLSDVNGNVLPPNTNLKLINNPVVDNWLIGEINNIRKSGTLLLSSVDLIQIKKYLLHILAENGLQFTENGYLVDIRGNKVKITNLKLRTVLISDPVAYKKLLAGRKCVTPYEIPYLEAVFVSLAHPSKVLGLIPLRMSTLPGCKGGKCTGRPCTRKHKSVIGHRHPSKLNLAPIFKKGLHDGHSQVKTVVDHVLKGLNHVDFIGARTGDVGGDKTREEDDDVEDGLGIRIIGGNPAVGSGTPVNSKGR